MLTKSEREDLSNAFRWTGCLGMDDSQALLSSHKELEAEVERLEGLATAWYCAAQNRGLCPSHVALPDPFYPRGEILGRGDTASMKAEVEKLRGALTLTDLHLKHGGTGFITEVRRAGIEPPQSLWATGDLDRGAVNEWVREVRRAALRGGEVNDGE